MSDTRPMFLVLFPVQEQQISEWCWGSCGSGLAGAIDIGPASGVPCNRVDCPHLDRQLDEALFEYNGRPVFVRKLKEVTP